MHKSELSALAQHVHPIVVPTITTTGAGSSSSVSLITLESMHDDV